MYIGGMAVKVRRGTMEEWAAANPILWEDEPGIDLTSGQIRIGDGKTPWLDLPFSTPQDLYDLILNSRREELRLGHRT